MHWIPEADQLQLQRVSSLFEHNVKPQDSALEHLTDWSRQPKFGWDSFRTEGIGGFDPWWLQRRQRHWAVDCACKMQGTSPTEHGRVESARLSELAWIFTWNNTKTRPPSMQTDRIGHVQTCKRQGAECSVQWAQRRRHQCNMSVLHESWGLYHALSFLAIWWVRCVLKHRSADESHKVRSRFYEN